MPNYKQKYLNAKNYEELKNNDIFTNILAMSFIEKLAIIKELINRGPITSFDFYKIEALAKYISLEDSFEVMIAIKYTIREIKKYEYLINSKDYQQLFKSLVAYYQEMEQNIDIKKSRNWYYNLTRITNNYHEAQSLYTKENNQEGLIKISKTYDLAILLIKEAKTDLYFPEIIVELTNLTFTNHEYDNELISKIAIYLGKESLINKPNKKILNKV